MRNSTILLTSLILGSVGHLATDIYLPSMPKMTEYFGSTTSIMQLSLTVYLLSFCITPLIIGPISDIIGRKKPVLIGINIAFLATLLCIFANHVYILILGRFLQGIGLGTVVCVTRTLLPDHFQGKQLAKYFSYMTIMMPFVLALGPPLGGFIQELCNWQCVFGFLLLYLIAIRFLATGVLNDKNTSMNWHEIIQSNAMNKTQAKIEFYFNSYRSLFINRAFIKYTLCTVLIFMGIISYLTISPFYFQEIAGLLPHEYGLLSIAFCGTTCISGIINSRLINYFSPRSILFLANGLILFSGSVLITMCCFNAMDLHFVIAAICLFFLAVPLSFANTGALALADVQGNFGAATALLYAMQYWGGSIGSFLMSFADQNSILPLGFAFVLIGTLYCLTLLMPEKARKDKLASI